VTGGSDEEAPTLENFMVGDSNRVAFGLARRLAMGAGVSANVVTIVGPHGVGKSHLLKGIEAALRTTRGEGSVLYMSSEDFTVAFVDGVKRKDTSDLRTLVRRAKVVLLDDFQFICSKPGTLVEFFSHLRAIVSNGGVVVLACDQTPALIDQLDDRMRDEIHGGVIAQMDLPERNLRREILRARVDSVAKAAAAIDTEFDLTDEWIDLLADRLPASGRALCGAVRNVYCGTVLAGKPIDRNAVEKSIQLRTGGAPSRAPRIDAIKDVTAKAYGVTKNELESACRKRPVRPTAPVCDVSQPPADQVLLPGDRADVRRSGSHNSAFRLSEDCGDGRLERGHGRRTAPAGAAHHGGPAQYALIGFRAWFRTGIRSGTAL